MSFYLPLVLLLTGLPLFLVLFLTAVTGYHLTGIEPAVVFIDLYRLTTSPVLVALPLFTLAGYILGESQAPRRLFNLMEAMIGWLPGGIALVALISSAVFTAFTGASGITIVAIGGVLLPILQKQGFDERFNLGFITTTGSLGLLFPPSLPLILFGIVSGVSIKALFIAGLIPGGLIILLFYLYILFISRRQVQEKKIFSLQRLLLSMRESIWEMPLPFLVIGGIYTGLFTVIEAAAVTVVYLFIVEFLIYRDLTLKQDFARVVSESMLLVGGILILLASALAFNGFLIDQQIPMKIVEQIGRFFHSRFSFLLALNLFLILVGCVLDIYSATVIVVPLILHLSREVGINPTHLGIIFLTNLEIGYLTPPVGLNLFISSFRFRQPIFKIYSATWPFLILLLLALIIITYCESLVLLLIN